MVAPDGILCARSHEWVLETQDNCVLVGLSDIRLKEIGDVVFIELPETGSSFSKDEVFATLESVRSACEVYMPVEGRVVDVNEKLINSPELISENPYEAWFVKVEPEDFQFDSQGLMEYDDYVELIS